MDTLPHSQLIVISETGLALRVLARLVCPLTGGYHPNPRAADLPSRSPLDGGAAGRSPLEGGATSRSPLEGGTTSRSPLEGGATWWNCRDVAAYPAGVARRHALPPAPRGWPGAVQRAAGPPVVSPPKMYRVGWGSSKQRVGGETAAVTSERERARERSIEL